MNDRMRVKSHISTQRPSSTTYVTKQWFVGMVEAIITQGEMRKRGTVRSDSYIQRGTMYCLQVRTQYINKSSYMLKNEWGTKLRNSYDTFTL